MSIKRKKEARKPSKRPVKESVEHLMKRKGIKRFPKPIQEKIKEIIEKSTGRKAESVEKEIEEMKEKIGKAIVEEEAKSFESTGLTKEDMEAIVEVGKRLREKNKKGKK